MSRAKKAKRRRQREARRRRQSISGRARVLARHPNEVDRELLELGERLHVAQENLAALPRIGGMIAQVERETGVHLHNDPSIRAFLEKCDREKEKTIHPIMRLTDEGVDWGVMPETGDEIGYGMHPYRTDDCLRAAIATATQIPIEQVPDLSLDQRLERGEDQDEISRTSWIRIEEWAASLGLRMKLWEEVPVPKERWIGISTFTGDSEDDDDEATVFGDHCLVMRRDDVLFNPNCTVVAPPGTKLLHPALDSITYGLSFESLEEET